MVEERKENEALMVDVMKAVEFVNPASKRRSSSLHGSRRALPPEIAVGCLDESPEKNAEDNELRKSDVEEEAAWSEETTHSRRAYRI